MKRLIYPRTLAELRMTVFVIWVFTAIVLSLMPFALLLRPRTIESRTAFSLVKLLSGLWLPALSCFSVYWFGVGDRGKAKKAVILSPQRTGALVLAGLYLFLCLLVVGSALFVQSYETDPLTNDPIGPTINEHLSEVVGWLQLLSPVLLAPIGFLTGKTPGND